jgi:hypothetical protein
LGKPSIFGAQEPEIPVNGRGDLLQFKMVSGWIGFGGANGNLVYS